MAEKIPLVDESTLESANVLCQRLFLASGLKRMAAGLFMAPGKGLPGAY